MTFINSSSVFEIDTKGTCLLCYQPEVNCLDDDNEDGTGTKPLKLLLRYLKVDVLKLGDFSASFQPFLEAGDNVDLSVSLCDKCTSVASEFFDLFQDFERIRMQLDNCVRKVHEYIEEGEKDEDLVRKYKQRVNPRNMGDLMNANIADKLRKETLEKCSLKLRQSLPKVGVNAAFAEKMSLKRSRSRAYVGNVKPGEVKVKPQQSSSKVVTGLPKDTTMTMVYSVDDDDHDTTYQPTAKRSKPTPITPKGANQDPLGSQTERRNGNGRYKCSHCEKDFSKQFQLRVHLLTQHTMTILAGRIPNEVGDEELNLAVALMIKGMHTEKAKNGKLHYKCGLCPSRYENWTMKAHLLSSHLNQVIEKTGTDASGVITVAGFEKNCKRDRVKCDICGKELANLNGRGLKKHKAAVHSNYGKVRASETVFVDQNDIMVGHQEHENSRTPPQSIVVEPEGLDVMKEEPYFDSENDSNPFQQAESESENWLKFDEDMSQGHFLAFGMEEGSESEMQVDLDEMNKPSVVTVGELGNPVVVEPDPCTTISSLLPNDCDDLLT